MRVRLTLILTFLIVCSFGQTGAYQRIKTLYDQGKRQEAIELGTSELRKLKTSDAAFKEIVRLRVDCFMELGNFESAIVDWKTLINIDPKDKIFYAGIAYAYWANSDLDNCIKYIDGAFALYPSDPMVLSNMSYYYGEAGKYKESIGYATTGLNQSKVDNSDKASLYNNRGFSNLKLKRFDKALEDINKSIALNPDNSFAYCYRAMTNIELNKMETVCEDLEKSKSLGGIQLTKDLIPTYCKGKPTR